MKIGILGTGFGCYHLEQYKQMKEVEQIVIWGRNEEKLNEIEDHFVSEKEKNTDIKYTIITTNDINTILMDDQIELVDVCLPNELHKDYVLKAMKSGKNVICEVPVMLSVNDLNEIIEYKKNSKVKCFADLFERFEFANEFLKNTVVNKEYGALRSIRVYRNTPPWWGS